MHGFSPNTSSFPAITKSQFHFIDIESLFDATTTFFGQYCTVSAESRDNRPFMGSMTMELLSLTEDGHDDVVLDDLDGAPRNEVAGDDDVALVHQRVPRGRVRRLELHG